MNENGDLRMAAFKARFGDIRNRRISIEFAEQVLWSMLSELSKLSHTDKDKAVTLYVPSLDHKFENAAYPWTRQILQGQAKTGGHGGGTSETTLHQIITPL